jgi:hypothetical protein
MGIQMELATVFTEPVLRRCWLLNKALESASLDEALKLARAADEFLGMGQPKALLSLNEQASSEGSSRAPCQDFQPVATLPIVTSGDDRAEQAAGHTSATNHIACTAKNASAAASDTHEDISDTSDPEESDTSDPEEAGSEPECSEQQAVKTSGLAVLTGMDDIVRYLRQQDDVVVSVGTASYLVNGRFELNPEELLARANKIRERHGKPLFQRLPYGFPAHNGDDTAGRRQDRTRPIAQQPNA